MQPYDICVVFGDDEMCNHLVWASDEIEAHRTVMLFYRDTTVLGVVFAANDKESN